jgi:hypothetical protein
MTAISLAFYEALQSVNVPNDKARAVADSLEQAIDSRYTIHSRDLATQGDIEKLRTDMEKLRGELKAEIAPLKWGMGFIGAGVLSIILKTFFKA